MQVMALALGGCLTAEPAYGITEDTGGHITYILGAMRALAARADVTGAEIVTRQFDEPSLGQIYAEPTQLVGPKLTITRIDSGNRAYLSKEQLAADRPHFIEALLADLRQRDVLPDLIHAHFADAAEVARAVRDEFGIPFIYTAHSLARDKAAAGQGDGKAMERRIALERDAMMAADYIVGSSRDECERQIPAYGAFRAGKIQRIRPGIDQTPASRSDLERAQSLIAPFLRRPDKPVILAIARPVRKKNLVALVQAFALDPALRETANLVILPGLRQSIETGEAEQVEVMRQIVDLIDKHDLHGRVAYPRHHTQGEVRGLYRLARNCGGVFVNPALTEPFGLTILEAAVHGLPVVATCHGGPVDIIAELEHGLLVDPFDVEKIGAAIKRVLSNRALWQMLSSNGAAGITQMDWRDYASSFMAVARKMVPAKSAEANSVKPRQLLVCDIDNTLTGCRKAAARLVRYLTSRPDMAFGIATGRSLVEAQRILREWDLPEPSVLITSVGSEIYWQDGNRLRRDRAFEQRIAKGWRPDTVSDCLSENDLLRPQLAIDQRRSKRSYICSDDGLELARNRLRAAGLNCKTVFSHSKLLDVLPQRAGKADAVRHVARAMGLPPGAVIVAGDSGNDLEMLESSAASIVVANAEPAVLALGVHPHVYVSHMPFAGGVLEGLKAMLRSDEKRAAGARPTMERAA
ncbi:MAG: HAD-IIB family hydrolase [Alteraurantiacibacter sp.]